MSLHDTTLAMLLSQIADRTPAPGGGAVASCVGALAASLGHMALAYSINARTGEQDRSVLQSGMDQLNRASTGLLELAEMDARAYGRLNALQKLPEDDPQRVAHWDETLREAIDVPVQVMRTAMLILACLRDLSGQCNRFLLSDLAIAAVLAEACVRSAAWNVRVNLPLLPDRSEAQSVRQHSASAVDDALEMTRFIETASTARRAP